MDTEADPIEIATDPAELEIVRRGLEAAGVKVDSAELTMLPKSTVEIDAAHVRQNLRLVEKLEDHDDVQRVTANFEISRRDHGGGHGMSHVTVARSGR